jgi:hypothetical protein
LDQSASQKFVPTENDHNKDVDHQKPIQEAAAERMYVIRMMEARRLPHALKYAK